MVSTSKQIELFHFEHSLWTKELSFFADELKIYEHRLETLSLASLSQEAMSKLEQFQNQFIRQKEVLDTLIHDIHLHEQSISLALQKGDEVSLDEAQHQELKGQMDTFKSIYNSLKARFMEYLAAQK
jgi:predicted NACHT family NTPase